jgi:hypothetical protein
MLRRVPPAAYRPRPPLADGEAMDDGAVPLDSTWSFLWGKRRWRRYGVDLDGELRWQQGRLPARVTNLSMGGALLEVRRSDITAALERLGRAPTHKVHTLFEPPVLVRFGTGRVVASSDMIRIAWRPDVPNLVYLACRFRCPLTPDDVHELGVEPRTCAAESGFLAVPSEKMPLQVNVATDATLEVYPRSEQDGAEAEGPAFRGPLVAMNRSALAVQLSARDAGEVVARLSSHAFDARVVVRGRTLWSGEAWLLAVRVREGAPELEVVVHATDEPGEALRGLFHGRTKAYST